MPRAGVLHPGPFLASLRDAEREKHKVPSQHMQVRGLGARTFWGPCRAVPLCSLLCGLGRMVGGNVQMGPCSPSSASPSLQRRMKSQECPEGQDSGGSQAPPPHYFLRHPHSPKCWVGPLLRLQEPGDHKGPQKPAPKFLPWSRDPSHVTAQSRSPARQADLHVRVLRAGLLAVPLGLPALVAVNELGQEGGLPGISCDELVLQELFGGGPLQGDGQVSLGEGWLGSSFKLLEL